jgi:hypothetical protein
LVSPDKEKGRDTGALVPTITECTAVTSIRYRRRVEKSMPPGDNILSTSDKAMKYKSVATAAD